MKEWRTIERILLLRGPITMETAPQFERAVHHEHAETMILDLTDVPYIDSVGLGSLVAAYVSHQKTGRCLVLTGMKPRVRKIMEITKVNDFFVTFGTTWKRWKRWRTPGRPRAKHTLNLPEQGRRGSYGRHLPESKVRAYHLTRIVRGSACMPYESSLPLFREYWRLFVVALLLAATNQIFSLLDPLIFRHVIDSYATKYHQYTQAQFIRGAGLLLLAAVGVAFVSRVAKNFQDYFVNVIVQRLGARMYSDGIRHSLDLPYQVFEDQRSGETLGKLQKVRSDVERFITAAINVIFISAIGIVFVMIYAFRVHWSIAPAFLITVPLLGIISSAAEQANQEDAEDDCGRDDGAGGVDDGVAAEYRIGQEPGACASGSGPAERDHRRRFSGSNSRK